jgi:hypothetical protein
MAMAIFQHQRVMMPQAVRSSPPLFHDETSAEKSDSMVPSPIHEVATSIQVVDFPRSSFSAQGKLRVSSKNASDKRSTMKRLGQGLSKVNIDSCSPPPSLPATPSVQQLPPRTQDNDQQSFVYGQRGRIETRLCRSFFPKPRDKKNSNLKPHKYEREDSWNTGVTSSMEDSLGSTCEDFGELDVPPHPHIHHVCHLRVNPIMSQLLQDHIAEKHDRETRFEGEEFPVIEWGNKSDNSLDFFDLGPEKTVPGSSHSGPAFPQKEKSSELTLSTMPHCLSSVSKKQNLAFESSPDRVLKRSKSISCYLCSLGSTPSLHLDTIY